MPTCQAWIISWSSVSFTSVLDRNLRSGSESATRQRLPRPAYEHCAEKHAFNGNGHALLCSGRVAAHTCMAVGWRARGASWALTMKFRARCRLGAGRGACHMFTYLTRAEGHALAPLHDDGVGGQHPAEVQPVIVQEHLARVGADLRARGRGRARASARVAVHSQSGRNSRRSAGMVFSPDVCVTCSRGGA